MRTVTAEDIRRMLVEAYAAEDTSIGHVIAEKIGGVPADANLVTVVEYRELVDIWKKIADAYVEMGADVLDEPGTTVISLKFFAEQVTQALARASRH